MARADVVVAVSDAVGRQIIDRLGADPDRVITVSPMLSPDLRQAIRPIVRSPDVMAEASCAANE